MIIGILALNGLALGSFVNALVWRLRMQDELKQSKSKKKQDFSILHGRSMCVHCKHTLAWFDLVPIFSWVQLKGQCRYCHKKISWQYPLVELLVGALAVASYIFWPFELNTPLAWATLIVWIIALVPMVALVVYDLKWMQMPTNLIYALDVIAVVFVGLLALSGGGSSIVVASVIGSVILGGLFWVIYQISDGKWIGGGDVRYGFAMGALLGWQKGLFGLALSSYLGTAVIIVLLIMRKYRKKMRIPFGPFLISATYLSMLFGQQVIDWYKMLVGL